MIKFNLLMKRGLTTIHPHLSRQVMLPLWHQLLKVKLRCRLKGLTPYLLDPHPVDAIYPPCKSG
jgi:hypothetical protein